MVLAYSLYAVGAGADGAMPFYIWFRYLSREVHGWAAFGAIMGAAYVYVRRLTSR